MFHHWFHSRSGHLSFQTCSNTCLDHCFTYINTSFMLHHSYLHELKGYLSHSHLRIRSISYLKGDSRTHVKGVHYQSSPHFTIQMDMLILIQIQSAHSKPCTATAGIRAHTYLDTYNPCGYSHQHQGSKSVTTYPHRNCRHSGWLNTYITFLHRY